MSNPIKIDIPVREYDTRVYLKPLEPIDLTVVCDETEIANAVKEYTDVITAKVLQDILRQLKEIDVGSGIAVIDKRDVSND